MLKMMHAKPASVWMAIAECIAALAAIALVAVIGYSEYADCSVARPSVAAASEAQNTRAQEHRKTTVRPTAPAFSGQRQTAQSDAGITQCSTAYRDAVRRVCTL